jgi:DUF2958 family protein
MSGFRRDIPFPLEGEMGLPWLTDATPRELRELRGPLGLSIERDEHFEADKTLSAYLAAARTRGRILT